MVNSKGITLLVEDNDQLARFYKLNLKVWTGARVARVSTLKELETFLQKNKDIALIISKASFTPVVKKYVDADNLRDIGLISIGQESVDGAIQIENGLNIKPVIQNAAKLLGVTAQDMANMVVPDFFPIDLECFSEVRSPACEIFIEKGDGYEPLLAPDEPVDKESLERLQKAGHECVYVKKADRLRMVTNITQEIVSNISPEVLNEKEEISAAEMANKLLHYKLQKVGITDETIELSKKNIKAMARASKRYPKLSQLVGRLLSNKAGFLYKHSQILMSVCSHLMSGIDWCNEEQRKTMNFVAFFHDIALSTDEQAKIHSEKQLKAAKLPEKEEALVNMHAQIAAELITKFPHAPMGADAIIRQHHGIIHGVGFSEHYSGNLSPLSIVFILAEEFTCHLIESENDLKMPLIIKKMREKFPTQRFKKIIDILEEVSA